MLKKLLLFTSMLMFMLSCSEDLGTILPIDDENEISDPVIVDSDGIEITMSWETEEDYFMLLLDLVVEDDFNEEISISENVEPFETVDIRSNFDEGIYNVIIQGAEFSSFNDNSEEVTFAISGFNETEELVFTVNVNELEEFETVTVIQIVVVDDSYTIRQIVDTI